MEAEWLADRSFLRQLLQKQPGWTNQQLVRLEGLRLYQEANGLREARDVEGALAKYQAAAVADPSLSIDVTREISETRRYVAMQLVYEGEQLAAQDNREGARQKFVAALELTPPSDTPVYVWIEPGEFLMGSSGGNEKPQHKVDLDGYWIMRTEVMNEQYKRCVDAGACDQPNNERWHGEEYAREPVTDVDWEQANTYAAWVGGRLPTEAEWEKACRGTDGRIYPWGNEPPSPELLNYYDSGLNSVVSVGSYPPGIHGLYDMAGNVWEWTNSLSKDYPYKADDGREGASSDGAHIVRSGSFHFLDRELYHCSGRFGSISGSWSLSLGFRVVSPGL